MISLNKYFEKNKYMRVGTRLEYDSDFGRYIYVLGFVYFENNQKAGYFLMDIENGCSWSEMVIKESKNNLRDESVDKGTIYDLIGWSPVGIRYGQYFNVLNNSNEIKPVKTRFEIMDLE